MIIKTIGVIGSGTMGGGIAIAAALSDHRVLLNDVSKDVIDASLERIKKVLQASVDKGKLSAVAMHSAVSAMEPAVNYEALGSADLVIEAAPESIELKKNLFSELSRICHPDAILATNTSSLSITTISTSAHRPECVVGMHFFNPAHIMKLVEVVMGRFTSDAVVATVMALAEKMGKTPVRVKDTPGFIVNRVARPFYNEALRISEDGVADIPQIDRIMKAHGFRMGPFELMDLIGNDVNYEVTRSLFEAFHYDPRYRPSHIQRAYVEAGQLGKKTGRGFYDYGDKE